MAYKITTSLPPVPKILIPQDTTFEDLMYVINPNGISELNRGDILLHVYDGFVLLSNPRISFYPGIEPSVELLPPGTQITLTVD